jgi:hypothetical protein
MLNLNNSPSDLENIRSKVSFKGISREIRAEMNQDNPFTEMNLKYLNSWAVELYKNSKIFQNNKIVIADLSFKVSNFKVAENEKLLTIDNPFLYIVYAHHDGNEVLKMYNNPDNKPETPYQVLLFIETDDGKFDFGKIVRVKFGSQVVNFLTEKNSLFTNSSELLAERYLKATYGTSVSLKNRNAINNEKATTNFKDLLVRAIEFEHKNIKLDDFSWFLLILQGLYFANMDVPKWLFETSHWIRSKKYKEAKYWNGDLPEKEYEPAFLPNSIFYNKPEDRKNAISEIINHPIKELQKEINQKLNSSNPIINHTRNHVNKVFENIYEITGGFIKNLSVIEVPDGFLDVYIKHVNAFWVGFYNGILELIAGIFDLIAIVILISKEEFGFRMGDGLIEIFEKLFNDVFYDTYEFIDKVLAKIGQLFIKLAIWIDTYEGKSYYIVKEIGEIIPEAITFLIPVLKGSKVAKGAALSSKAGKEIVEETAEQSVKELTEQEAKQLSKSAKEALENGSAKEAQKQGLKEAEEKLLKLTDYEELGLLNKYSKVFNGIKYDVLVYKDRISWKVADKRFNWDNHAKLWDGELEFDLNTFGVKGLGQQWTDETFQIFGNKIKTIKVEWKSLPNYPGGESLGYKQFYKVFNETYDLNKAAKSTRFFETMSKREFDKIKYVDAQESIIVILTK